MAGSIQKGDHAFRRLDMVGADVLRDSAGLATGYTGAANVIEERRLAVVNVPHNRDDRRARQRLGACSLSSLRK